jgi:carbon storage regulator
MLVLTRKPGQSIMIGDGVEIQVLSVAGEKVRLGVTAPREVGIYRNEVYERIAEEREEASVEEEETDDESPERPKPGRFAPGQVPSSHAPGPSSGR